MKYFYIVTFSIITILIFMTSMQVQAKTLVKYNINSGNIIQTNKVDEMPSEEILNDRFRSEYTDVILIDDSVDISKQKVNLSTKQIIDKSKQELELNEKVNKEIREEKELIDKELQNMAIKMLKDKGIILKHYEEEE